MTILQSILLGIIQGLTEFLPVSSSGHLVIAPYLLNWQKMPEQETFIFDVLIQVATLAAVIAYFRADLWQIVSRFLRGLWQRQPFADPYARMGWYLILATIPAGLAGLMFKDQLEGTFSNPVAAAVALLCTAGLLLAAERVGRRSRRLESLDWKDALWVGLFQMLALFPGISRSGTTITGGMLRDLDRATAARFSFLMSVPVMLAAGLTAALDLPSIENLNQRLPVYSLGFLTAAVVGYLSIRWLLRYLATRPLYVFSIYCAGLALLTLGVSLLGR